MDGGRHLEWDGLANARDLGGLPTRSGGRTRRGVLVRSECPDRLSDAGWRALAAHGITTCVDLRSGWEADERPYAPPLPGVTSVASPLEEGLLADEEFRGWATTGLLGTALYYAPFLARWPDRAVAAVAAVADAPGGVLFHCQRGRDRTGLVSLLLLAAAGVPDEVIVADVAASDARLAVAAVDRTPDEVAAEDALYAARGTTAEAALIALLTDLDVEALLPSPTLTAIRTRLVG
jgi:protein-tyrosine phosphatase